MYVDKLLFCIGYQCTNIMKLYLHVQNIVIKVSDTNHGPFGKALKCLFKFALNYHAFRKGFITFCFVLGVFFFKDVITPLWNYTLKAVFLLFSMQKKKLKVCNILMFNTVYKTMFYSNLNLDVFFKSRLKEKQISC